MRNPVEFTADLFDAADDWADYAVILLIYLTPFWILHGCANAMAAFVANGGPSGAYNAVNTWQVMFRTGFYPYDVLMWVLQLPFMVILGFVAIIGFLAAMFGIGGAIVTAVERFNKLMNRV